MTSMRFSKGEMKGKVLPPPSKSHTHRAFFLASMAKGESVVIVFLQRLTEVLIN